MQIRLAQEADLPTLAALYRQTVFAWGPQHYTLAQTAAWASFAADAAQFRAFILEVTTFVACDRASILGFAGIDSNGHIASVYVRHDCLHQGIGSALMQTVLDHAQETGLQRLYAEASEFSLGLFQKFDFHRYDTEIVERKGVQFERYLVERQRQKF
ncbi:MAG: GNAT family N-acetyltransferase [Leptolyngbya sp. SIO4C1]|nr:GNAT family N-acetyltransferase [Leptolyngbya sp. SIO4C1]